MSLVETRTSFHYYRESVTVSEPSEIDTRVVLRFACLPSHRGRSWPKLLGAGLGRDRMYALVSPLFLFSS
ncbi:hypothetical protein CsSME_00031393 [Camellia sinensis var. sinensis]